MKPMITNLEKLLGGPRDGPVLRFSLGNAWLPDDVEKAIVHFREAVRLDPVYSAAWKGLGKALEQAGHLGEALEAYRHGATVAEHRGDKQAAKEMNVFARRLEKKLAPPPGAEAG